MNKKSSDMGSVPDPKSNQYYNKEKDNLVEIV